MNATALVVGASVAGIRTAQALRGEGWSGRIVVAGEEDHPPYDRPPLSKQMLTGRGAVNPAPLLPEQAGADTAIDLLLGVRADLLDSRAKRVVLHDGRELWYDQLIIATGASARPSPWGEFPQLYLLRNLDDCNRLRRALHEEGAARGRVVIVGAGFIGSEVAAAARGLGHAVSIVDPLPAPLGRLLGPDVGAEFTALHHRHGVETHFGSGVRSITESGDRLRVLLDDGTELFATIVVVGIGAKPNVCWLEGSGVVLGDGVLCDEQGRALGVPDVSAVGDVACWVDPQSGSRRRVEHWTRAVEHANQVARRLCGTATQAEPLVDYVWSDLYDWKTQIVGRPVLGDRTDMIGKFDGGETRAAVLYADVQGSVVGGLTINWPRATLMLRRAIAQRGHVSDARALIKPKRAANSAP